MRRPRRIFSGYISHCPEEAERFLARLPERREGECWPFPTRAKTKYARFYLDYRAEFAHRAAYAIFNGDVPSGMIVMHVCDNPPCVNPAHLKLGTPKDNTQDARSKGRLKRPPGWVHPNPVITRVPKKLTVDIVRAIRASHDSLSVLAARYDIDQSTASYVRNRKRWVWVQDLPTSQINDD